MSTLPAEFPVEEFRYWITTFGDADCAVPGSVLCRAFAAWSNERTRRLAAEEQVATLKRENQMLWNSIAARDEAQP